jgi:malate/lactate dehydrogenase
VAVERLAPAAARAALARVEGRWPGPAALAAAAVRVLRALASADASVLSVMVSLAGEYGHRGRALAVPARLGHGRLLGVVEIELDPVDRVAFDNAAGRASR